MTWLSVPPAAGWLINHALRKLGEPEDARFRLHNVARLGLGGVALAPSVRHAGRFRPGEQLSRDRRVEYA